MRLPIGKIFNLNSSPLQYVYILKCSDGTYYTGCTNELDERLKRHKAGYVEYTKAKLPVEVVFYSVFQDKHLAFEFEQYLKTGSGIAFRNKHLLKR